ncbi:MAG: hypothetical protein ABSA76_14170, partial [Bacteroidales bacterium]
MINNKVKYLLIGIGIIICALGFYLYSLVFGINIFPEGKKAVLLIPDGAVYVQLMDSVRAHLTIRNQKV